MRMARALALSSLFLLSGCGTYVPELTNFRDSQIFTIQIHTSILCEIIDSIKTADKKVKELDTRRGYTGVDFQNWGVLYTTTLTITEDSSVAPSISGGSLLAVNPVFTIGGGLNYGAKATRSETTQNFVSVKRAVEANPCLDAQRITGLSGTGNSLKLSDWLITQLTLVDTNIIPAVGPKESFTYLVKFDVSRSISASPQWSFVNRNVSRVGGVFSAGRNSSHSVLFTFGPVDQTRVQLEQSALQVHSAKLIGESIARQ